MAGINSTTATTSKEHRPISHGHIAYIRVSSTDQNTGRQLGPECGQQFTKVFENKTSGKDTNRPALKECLSTCGKVTRSGYTPSTDLSVAFRISRI